MCELCSDVAKRGFNNLVMRAELFRYVEDYEVYQGTPMLCATIDLLFAADSPLLTRGKEYWLIHFVDNLDQRHVDDPRMRRNPELSFGLKKMGLWVAGHNPGPQQELMDNLHLVVEEWKIKCQLWVASNACVITCGNIGAKSGAIRLMDPSHLVFMQYYSSLRSLIGQALCTALVSEEKRVLVEALNKLEGFIKVCLKSWDKAQEMLGVLTAS